MAIVNYQRKNNSNPSFTVTENRLSEQVPAAQTIWSSLDGGDSGGIRKRGLEDNLDTCLRRVKRMRLNDGNETVVNEKNINYHESEGGVAITEVNDNEPSSVMKMNPLLTRNDNIVQFIAETCVMNTEVGQQLIELELIQEE
ncbi:hypothetical protein QAD02_003554 [Eretmocerus hayati]|uniref:Uncharacterized protein n=1 Tax=Eretmocerus hayati TaxID=131215 RepID=A0ACC2NM01_9HYME|nr:hypothetical protein QAD02_003554 [Eretmocerus hayati]